MGRPKCPSFLNIYLHHFKPNYYERINKQTIYYKRYRAAVK